MFRSRRGSACSRRADNAHWVHSGNAPSLARPVGFRRWVGLGCVPGKVHMATDKYRIEHDLLGDRQVPADAYYGVHTLRAVENFPITGTPISIYPDLLAALASIKLAAARSNQELGLLDATRADAIIAAAEEIRAGRLHAEFVVDVIQ